MDKIKDFLFILFALTTLPILLPIVIIEYITRNWRLKRKYKWLN